MALNQAELKDLQRGMNLFTGRYLHGVAPLIVDGKRGRHTNARIRMVKYYLGYRHPRGSVLNAAANTAFRERVWHPKSLRYSSAPRLALAATRRIKQRKDAKANDAKAHKTTGVGMFDGRPVANVAIPILEWCRHNGWNGTLVSGWRDPIYSRSLCRRMCGRDSCPGMCAGLASNHVGSTAARFAVDVSDYVRFGEVVAHCPVQPRIHNALRNDRVHFSPSGG